MKIKAKKIIISSAGLSDVGLVRENNEDAWKVIPEKNVFVLADGMGGHAAGEIAAQESVDHYSSLIQNQSRSDLKVVNAKSYLLKVVQEVNHFVFKRSREDHDLRGMGTTLCCVLFVEQMMFFAHVGDSRIYQFRQSQLTQLTEDHSLVQELLDLGELNTRQAQEFTQRNVITKAIGTEPFVQPEVGFCEVRTGDLILLCTDGLSDLISNREIQKILGLSASIERKVELFVESAKRRGGQDNVTAILLEVKNDTSQDLS